MTLFSRLAARRAGNEPVRLLDAVPSIAPAPPLPSSRGEGEVVIVLRGEDILLQAFLAVAVKDLDGRRRAESGGAEGGATASCVKGCTGSVRPRRNAGSVGTAALEFELAPELALAGDCGCCSTVGRGVVALLVKSRADGMVHKKMTAKAPVNSPSPKQ